MVCFLQFVGDTGGQYFFNVVVVVAVVQVGAIQMVGMFQGLSQTLKKELVLIILVLVFKHKIEIEKYMFV